MFLSIVPLLLSLNFGLTDLNSGLSWGISHRICVERPVEWNSVNEHKWQMKLSAGVSQAEMEALPRKLEYNDAKGGWVFADPPDPVGESRSFYHFSEYFIPDRHLYRLIVQEDQGGEVEMLDILGEKVNMDRKWYGKGQFQEGLVAMNSNDEWNDLGKAIICGSPYYSLSNSWGYVDWNGKCAIEPQFSFASTFHEGFAVVGVGGYRVLYCWGRETHSMKCGIINQKGCFVVPPCFQIVSTEVIHNYIYCGNAPVLTRELSWPSEHRIFKLRLYIRFPYVLLRCLDAMHRINCLK